MDISPKTAMSIVRELKSIIKEDITFMDTSCHIIACTDEKRIGDYHGASAKMFANHLSELEVASDTDYEGTRSGINMTIEVSGEAVAVVGITGRYEKVCKYGQIIKKMTEILLMEDLLKEQRRREGNLIKRFLQQWLTVDEGTMTKRLAHEGFAAGIDISLPRRVVVFIIDNSNNEMVQQETIDMVEQQIYHALQEDPRNISAGIGNSFVALISERPDASLQLLLKKIGERVLQKCGCILCIGADSMAVAGAQVKGGYYRALKAVNAAGPLEVVYYDDILMELVTNDVPRDVKVEFIQKVFRRCEKEKIPEYINMLSTLYSCNGSIQETAEKLFMHKNTLQYRIKKLGEITGRDPRKINEIPLYYMAIALYQSERDILR